MPSNPILFALVVYGLTLVIAMMVGGIIWVIGRVVRTKESGAVQGTKE